MDNDLISYRSIFEPDVIITVIFKENENYETLKPIFDEYGYGFFSPYNNTIMIDGDFFISSDDLNINDLRFVEAHEISHLILGHDGPRSDDDELDADLGAYILLKRNNLPTKRLEDEFEHRHGIRFNKKLLVRIENML